MIRVLVVVPGDEIRDAVAKALSRDVALEVAGRASGVDEALRLDVVPPPDVVVVSFQQITKEGTEAVSELREGYPHARVVVLSKVVGEPVLLSAFAVGTHAFVSEHSDPSVLIQGVRAAYGGGTFIDPAVAGKLVDLAVKNKRTRGPHGLTLQQRRVLERLPRGLTNAEIGEELGISENTVKTHVRNVLRKLGVDDRAQAAAVAKELGLL